MEQQSSLLPSRKSLTNTNQVAGKTWECNKHNCIKHFGVHVYSQLSQSPYFIENSSRNRGQLSLYNPSGKNNHNKVKDPGHPRRTKVCTRDTYIVANGGPLKTPGGSVLNFKFSSVLKISSHVHNTREKEMF